MLRGCLVLVGIIAIIGWIGNMVYGDHPRSERPAAVASKEKTAPSHPGGEPTTNASGAPSDDNAPLISGVGATTGQEIRNDVGREAALYLQWGDAVSTCMENTFRGISGDTPRGAAASIVEVRCRPIAMQLPALQARNGLKVSPQMTGAQWSKMVRDKLKEEFGPA